MEKISVIIPVYNVEKYLVKCIDSVINQTYTNLEIILVDDGSPDRCPQICDEYAKKDSRVHVIHKKNEGVARAREVALEKMSGDYVCFLDADDRLDLHFCETMFKLLKDNNADWVSCSIDRDVSAMKQDEIITDMTKLFDDYINCKLYALIICAKLFKAELLKGYKFRPLRIGEDTCCIIDVFVKTNKAVLSSYEGYKYTYRESSQTAKKYDESKLDIFKMDEYISGIFNEYYKSGYYKQYSRYAIRLITDYVASFSAKDRETWKNCSDYLYRRIKEIEIKKVKTVKVSRKVCLFFVKYFKPIADIGIYLIKRIIIKND
ncbi:MAG: glycosyltransferase family 2 protein [Monoglobales bacterium]